MKTFTNGIKKVLMVSLCVWAVHGLNSPLVAADESVSMRLSDENGQVQRFHQGSNGRMIIHIQDPHSNYSGQKNLAECVRVAMEQYGISLILVEGGSMNGTLTPFKRIADPRATNRVAHQLLLQGKLSGEEYLNLTSSLPMQIQGIENEKSYRESIRRYSDVVRYRDEALAYVGTIRSALSQVKGQFYPRLIVDYERQAPGSGPDFHYLLKIAHAYKIELSNFPEIDRIRFRLNQPVDDGFVIDFDRLFAEWQRLEDEVYLKALPTVEGRWVRAIDRYTVLLEKAFQLQLSADEFHEFSINEPDFTAASFLSFLNKKLLELGKPESVIGYRDIVEKCSAAVKKFYASVEERDTAFLKNSATVMQNEGQENAILISGGYHTAHLESLFSQQGYSFMVVTPKVQTETHQAKYEALLLSSQLKGVWRREDSSMLGRNAGKTVRVAQAGSRLAEIVRPLANAAGVSLENEKVVGALKDFRVQGFARSLSGARLTELEKLKSEFKQFWQKIGNPSAQGSAGAKFWPLIEKWDSVKKLAMNQDVFLDPSFLEIHLTEHCQNDCGFCRIKEGQGLRNVPDHEVSLGQKQTETLIDEIHEINPNLFVRFSGTIGEPLLNKHAKQIFQKLNAYKMRWALVTNGLLLDKVSNELLSAEYINISIDAGSDATYVRLKRPKGDFINKPYTRVIQNITDFIHKRNESGSKARVTVSVILQKENYKEIVQLAHAAKEIGVDQFEIKMQHADERRAMTAVEIRSAYKRFAKIAKMADDRFHVKAIQSLEEALVMSRASSTALISISDVLAGKPQGPVQTVNFSRCFANMLGLNPLIDPHGALRACCQIYQSILPSQGDLDSGLKASWQSQQRQDSLQKDPRQHCVSCSPSDAVVNQFIQFLQDAHKKEPSFLQFVEDHYIRPAKEGAAGARLSLKKSSPILLLRYYDVAGVKPASPKIPIVGAGLENLTYDLFAERVSELTETKTVVLSIGMASQSKSDLLKAIYEFQSELRALNYETEKLKLVIQLVDAEGQRMGDEVSGFVSDAYEPQSEGQKVHEIYYGVPNAALVEQLKLKHSGLLATEPALTQGGVMNIPHKPGIRTAVLAALAETSHDEVARRSLSNLMQVSLDPEDVQLVREVPMDAILRTYTFKLTIKALGLLSETLNEWRLFQDTALVSA